MRYSIFWWNFCETRNLLEYWSITCQLVPSKIRDLCDVFWQQLMSFFCEENYLRVSAKFQGPSIQYQFLKAMIITQRLKSRKTGHIITACINHKHALKMAARWKYFRQMTFWSYSEEGEQEYVFHVRWVWLWCWHVWAKSSSAVQLRCSLVFCADRGNDSPFTSNGSSYGWNWQPYQAGDDRMEQEDNLVPLTAVEALCVQLLDVSASHSSGALLTCRSWILFDQWYYSCACICQSFVSNILA